LSPLELGGQTVVLLKHVFSGAQVCTAPLALVNVTFRDDAGMPIAASAMYVEMAPIVVEQLFPVIRQPCPWEIVYRAASFIACARV